MAACAGLYSPAAHSVHSLAPAASPYCPSAQFVQLAAEVAATALLKVPGAHSWQSSWFASRNLPAGHASQLRAPEEPRVSVKFPRGQTSHDVAPTPRAKCPAVQLEHDALASVPNCPAAHALQARAPLGCGLTTLPASQPRHATRPPAAAYMPAVQFLHDDCRGASWNWPGGQASQRPPAVAVAGTWNLPAMQSVHLVALGSGPNLPAGHSWQGTLDCEPN